jgi:hypothetical protein
MSDTGFTPLANRAATVEAWSRAATVDNLLRFLEDFEHRVRDDEARAAADRVEALPYRDHGRTVNRNDAIMTARRGLPR